MNGLPQGLEHRLGQMSELASYLGLGLVIVCIGLAVVPFVLWWNTARTNRLLGELIEEQEKTNELLRGLAAPAPSAPDAAPGDSDKADPDPTDTDQFTLT